MAQATHLEKCQRRSLHGETAYPEPFSNTALPGEQLSFCALATALYPRLGQDNIQRTEFCEAALKQIKANERSEKQEI
jgi:hypothetical protein